MKKFLTTMLLSIYLFLFPFPALTASAESPSTYACILNGDVMFYQTATEDTPLFTLPKTYFVKVLSSGSRFTKVEYLSHGAHTKPLIGYCLTEQLTFVDFTPVNPYLYATFDVIYAPENAEIGDAFLEKLTFTCGYYGTYVIGNKEYAYVLRDGEFVYVPKPLDFHFPESQEYAEHQAQAYDASASNSSATPIQVGVLVVLCLLVPLLSALIIKNSKSPFYSSEED